MTDTPRSTAIAHLLTLFLVVHAVDLIGKQRAKVKARARAMDSNVFEKGRDEKRSTGQHEAKAFGGGEGGRRIEGVQTVENPSTIMRSNHNHFAYLSVPPKASHQQFYPLSQVTAAVQDDIYRYLRQNAKRKTGVEDMSLGGRVQYQAIPKLIQSTSCTWVRIRGVT